MTTQDRLSGPFNEEIRSFIVFKRESGFTYTTAAFALSAFDKFSDISKDKDLSLKQLAEAWVEPCGDRPRYDDGACIRQLGQYLTEIGHPAAFTLLSGRGNRPRLIGVTDGPFGAEIEDFIDHKRSTGRKYVGAEYGLRAFDKFCSMSANELLSPQQLADAWQGSRGEDSGIDISFVREFGLHLSMQSSKKSFILPYADGSMPRPAFVGYESLYANEIDSFLTAMRSAGLKYRHEAICLKDFDRFCRLQPHLSLQQMADAFICSQKGLSSAKGKRSTSVMRAFGGYLTEKAHPDVFTVPDRLFVTGPYREEISAFVAFKRSCGFKYKASGYQLKCFDAFCSVEDNKDLSSQQLADKWVLKKGDEHPNTRSARVGPARVFGKYLTAISHPMAFSIADDVARGGMAKPPYLFDEVDIGLFFDTCAELEPDETDPSAHIVLPAAFLFMHCLGVRTCELKVLLKDVDFGTGEVIIVDAKNGTRVVYMSEELSGLLSRYSVAIEEVFPNREYLFPASIYRPRADFSKRFSEIWGLSVSASAVEKPRLYDFRHHLLYRNVELCMRNDGDVNVLRPYVMRHMGHSQPESFQYYFHLSPPIRKEVSRVKESLDWMMPDIPEVPYE